MENPVNIMVDLETLGRTADARVFAIGACVVRQHKIGPTFYCLLDPDRQTDRVADHETMDWWAGQSERVREELTRAYKEGVYPAEAFSRFNAWLEEVSPSRGHVQFWGNGPEFDLTILSSLFNYRLDWPFRATQSLRTARLLLPECKRPTPEIPHHAKYDAIAQGQWLIEMHEKGLRAGSRPFLF